VAIFAVKSGRDEFGESIVSTVKADTFATDENFVVFKVGSVVVKAITKWSVDSVELMDPPPSKDN
jgi:hypothetical protein|tara:strand:- start:33923 stop:34117 length:195 start_codon:yes stop_codon:yes gene_type:complete